MYIGLGILAIIAIYLVSFYNGLKTALVQIGASIQEIGNQLKRQADLIPNLVESVKGFMKQEKGIFEDLTSARRQIDTAVKSNNPKDIDKAQDLISKVMGSINVIMESNPEIKSNTLVADLMDELRDTSDKIMYARRTLIDLSADYNIKISTIPGMWLAPMFGFTPQKGLDTPVTGAHLEVSAADTINPTVKLN
ncbi:MAG: LemA family protein [Candidatus Shapirobacteria bacterium]